MNLTVKTFAWAIALFIICYHSFLYAEDINKDQGILLWLITVDNDEISKAKIALHKTKSANIKSYAEEMINDHSLNLKETKQLLNKIGGSQIKLTDNQK